MGWGPWGALGSQGSAPCRDDMGASREFGGGSKTDRAYKRVGGYARTREIIGKNRPSSGLGSPYPPFWMILGGVG